MSIFARFRGSDRRLSATTMFETPSGRHHHAPNHLLATTTLASPKMSIRARFRGSGRRLAAATIFWLPPRTNAVV